MKLNGFSLEILVNGEPLAEFSESVSKLKKSMTTGPSYTRKSITAPEDPSPVTNYAAVQEFGTRYAVRFSAPPLSCSRDDPIKVFLYVDGEYDYSYTDINPEKLNETRTCFWSKTRDKIYYFKFNPTIWSEEDNNSFLSSEKTSLFGGPGAISVYFYRAQRIAWNVAPPPDYNVEPAVVPENNNTRAIKLSTQYDVQSVPNPSITRFDTYLQEHGPPLAVLHLHYRAAAWLRARGHYVPYPRRSQAISGERPFIEVEDDQSSVKIKQEGVTIKDEPDVDSNATRASAKRRKKSLTPEIIVLSSDDEGNASNSKKARILNNNY
ncbi:11745_t:CDS:2 [Acaulospora colombiana]|uniref:11745_t:CDS:1 n=1 Tax=Acaulospora colombiana TaxID=27376 RepID=A0ACA9KUZ6_9GLOM|nr:11745_t:CDS:2 [Acaulospora colombiana]